MFEQIVLSLVAAISLIAGLLVLRGSGSGMFVRAPFFCICLALTVWALSLGWFLSATSAETLDVSSRLFYISAAVFCPLMVVFALGFPRGVISTGQKTLIYIALTAAVTFTIHIALTPQFIIDMAAYQPGSAIDVSRVHIHAGSYILFALFFIAFFVLAMVIAIAKWQKARGRERSQIKAFALGMIVASVPGFIVDLYLPSLGNYSLVWAGPLAILLFLGVIAYSIVRFGMFDIRAAAARTMAYVLLIGTLAGVYFVAAYVLSQMMFSGQSKTEVSLSPINIFLALLLAFIFQPIKHFFDQLTNKLFYHGEYDSETFFREFGRILFFDTDLQLLLKQASVYLATNLKAERVFFYITDRGVYGRSGTQKLRMPADDIGHIAKYYRLHHESPEVIVTDAVKDEELGRILLSHQVQITLPLMLQNQAIGYLFLGDHKSHGYTARDLRTLESVANELTIAVQNSLSVEEVRELNETLQHRVEDATRELRESNRQLQRLDEAKNEFISMASHQLRTPLTSIKGYLDMLLEGDLGRVTATQRSVLSEAFLSSERMVGLINDFLNVSRIQTGKFILELRDSDLSGLVQEQVQGLEVMAKQHELAFTQHIAKDVPHTAVDIDKIRHVVMNMLDNAIYYSKPGSTIEVSLTKKQSDIFFKVKDTGIGVPKQEQSQLFGKFFRASNARKKRPDGTGVGLFLAKKVIAAHGGEIIFESVEGQGSTFGFRLPIRDAQPDT